jgi:hypothetical protein
MPTRVLKISPSSARSEFGIELHVPTDFNRYAALSYCWGGEQPHKTTSSRLLSAEPQIPWTVLPQTIKDAVKVTHGLGLQYLWVDSLCIIQDDERDIATEIASMPSVYSQAVVTIVAARASCASEGFMNDLDLRWLSNPIFKLPYRCHDGSIGSVYTTVVTLSRPDEPLNSRAWALQERYLSRRILEYGSTRLRWICGGLSSMETSTDGWRTSLSESLPGESISSPREVSWDLWTAKSADSGTAADAHRHWMNLVEAYTHRSLTIPKDRVLAISGIAARLAPLIGSDYLAGHWRDFLAADLQWSASGPVARPQQYLGPSWSWTAVNGKVRFANYTDHLSFSIRGVDMQLESPDAEFGAVSKAELLLNGRLRPARWVKSGRFQYVPNSDNLSGCDDEAGQDLFGLFQKDAIESDFDKDQAGCPEFLNVVLLELCSYRLPKGPWSMPVAMVLRQRPATEGSGMTRFSRLGLFRFDRTVYDVRRSSRARGTWDHPEPELFEQRIWFKGIQPQTILIE